MVRPSTRIVSNRCSGNVVAYNAISQERCRGESIGIPLLGAERWSDYISEDFALALEKPVNVVFLLLDGHEPGDWLAALGNNHGLALGLDFIHDCEAMNFELTSRNGLHGR